MYRKWILVLAVSWTFSLGVSAQAAAPAGESLGSVDMVSGPPFQEGDVLTFDHVDKLEGYLPPAFWENHEYFFYEGGPVDGFWVPPAMSIAHQLCKRWAFATDTGARFSWP